MPANNNFRHQEYCHSSITGSFHLLRGVPEPDLCSQQCQRKLCRIGECLLAAGVAEIWLVHGTFVGTDAWGVYRKVASLLPAAADKLRTLQKKLIDSFQKDICNYTSTYAQQFESAINGGGNLQLPVRLFHWPSENHHIGRCHGAVTLIDELASSEIPVGKRVLLWGHSHGGNLFSLASNILGCDAGARDDFFRAAQSYYRLPASGPIDNPVWRRVQQMLGDDDHPLSQISLDFATFGTPIRYGWDSGGYAKLLHFVNHRPADGLPLHQAAFPSSAQDFITGSNGDFVQQIGIAGSNFAPTVVSWRAWLANKRLRRLLHQGLKPRSLLARVKEGVRVPDEGATLLVDYGSPDGGLTEYQAGHAVYTKTRWLPFQIEHVAKHFYGYAPEDQSD